jgi:hypothetical protein
MENNTLTWQLVVARCIIIFYLLFFGNEATFHVPLRPSFAYYWIYFYFISFSVFRGTKALLA